MTEVCLPLRACTGSFRENMICHFSFWKKLWLLKIPGKVVNLLWRVCRGCLPTLAALASRHVNVDIGCHWCKSECETDSHALFECGFARTVWAMSRLQRQVQGLQNESAFDRLVHVFHSVTRDQCAMVGMICWKLWNR